MANEIEDSQRVDAMNAKRQYDKIISQRKSIVASNREIKKKYGENVNAEQVRQLQSIEKQRALQQFQQKAGRTAQQVSFTERQQAYAKSRTGRFTSGLRRAGSLFSMGGLRSWSYGGQVAPRVPTAGKRIGRGRAGPGRPVGTLYPRYKAYGGVYNFRKAMSHQRALERIQAARSANISPEQQQIINRIAAERNQRMGNPENRVIPDTGGQVPLRRIMDEIDQAAHIFD